MTIIRVIDTETTGMEPTDAVVEAASWDLQQDADGKWSGQPTNPWSTLVNPLVPIPPEAMAVHHITDHMVLGAPVWEQVLPLLIKDNPPVYAAHNLRFDSQFISFPSAAKLICTYKCALTLAPNAPAWKNQVLRYWLKLEVDPILADPPHRASGDAYVTAHLLRRMLTKATVDQLVDISSKPVILPKLAFGKHAMQPCESIPSGYWRWILDNIHDDEDVRATAFHYLQKNR